MFLWEDISSRKKIKIFSKKHLTRGIVSVIIPLALEGIPQTKVGVYNIEVPPVPIPNTVVKLNRAENTWRVAAWEDRSSPTFFSLGNTPVNLP